MRFPEKLFQLTEKDRQSFSLVTPYFNRLSAAAASTGFFVTATLDNIGDRFLVLSSANGEGASGAAQFCVRALLRVGTPASETSAQNFSLAGEWPLPLGTRPNAYVNWSGEIWIQPMWNVSLFVEFSAAGAVNTGFLNLIGMLVPRGSIQRL